MTLNFFSTPKDKPDNKRTDALNTVRDYLNSRPYLPRDLRMALHLLLPQIRPRHPDDIEYDPPHGED